VRKPCPTKLNPEFDAYATDYDAALEQGISISGEHKEYFAQGRVNWLAGQLAKLKFSPLRIFDFGCGTGTGARLLAEKYTAAKVLGVDISSSSLEVGRRLHDAGSVKFQLTEKYQPTGDIDLAFCNGVFHHIPLAERAGAVDTVFRSLKPGGLFAFWENNPWNPGTRYVMSRIPFDRDAITLSPPEARRLLQAGGFEILRTDFQFVFPKVVGWLRAIEPALATLPLGAQYMVLACKR
jgi:SAM-dependent methyltransferase